MRATSKTKLSLTKWQTWESRSPILTSKKSCRVRSKLKTRSHLNRRLRFTWKRSLTHPLRLSKNLRAPIKSSLKAMRCLTKTKKLSRSSSFQRTERHRSTRRNLTTTTMSTSRWTRSKANQRRI